MDYGHAEAERRLKELEKELEGIYNTALVEISAKANAYFTKFFEHDKAKIADVNAGRMTEKDYLAWRQQKMLVGERYDAMKASMAQDLVKADQIAMSMINKSLPSVYAINSNYGAYEIEKGMKIGYNFELVDEATIERLVEKKPKMLPKARVSIPEDKKWNEKKLNSALLQGILQGESIPNMAKRLRSVTDMDKNASIRNARTMVTGAENGGRLDRYLEAQAKGIELEKMWIATLDNRTRDAHLELDGVAVPLEEKFKNSIGEIDCPGDPDADPANVYNCRCTLIAKLKGHDYDMSDRVNELDERQYKLWEEAHRKRDEETEKSKEKPYWERIRELASGNTIGTEEIREAGKLITGELKLKYEARVQAAKDAKANWNEFNSRVEDEAEKCDNYRDRYKFMDIVTRGEEITEKYPADYTEFMKTEHYKIALDLHKEHDVLYREYHDTKKALKDIDSNANELKEILSKVRDMGISHLEGDGEKAIKEHFESSRSPARKLFTWAYDQYPTSWIEKSLERGTLKVGTKDRGYYMHGVEIMTSGYDDNDKKETCIHELGHRFERSISAILEQEKEFYERRTDGESLVWLGGGYGKNEKTRKDDFINSYMGKDYGGSAYELVSMGFEAAYSEPQTLAEDPDMQEWIYGLLALVP